MNKNDCKDENEYESESYFRLRVNTFDFKSDDWMRIYANRGLNLIYIFNKTCVSVGYKFGYL